MTTVFQRVGPFEILQEIGRGGMASVFLARDERHGRNVALKLVPLGEDREHREILEAERFGSRLQAELSGRCSLVPRVYEVGDVPPYYFIAMEYLEGENLSDLIGRGPVPLSQTAAVGVALCQFLDSAHGFETTIDGRSFCSLVHGDLKPRNVRLCADGSVRVLDFGIAKALSLSRKVTRNDFGSMPYLSPERLDSVEVSAHADLWALGVILYEMLGGTLPFHARDTRRLEEQIRLGYGRRPLGPDIPLGWRALVSRLLAPEMSDRYGVASEVLADLERVQSGAVTDAEQNGWPARAEDAPTVRTRPLEGSDEATRRTKPAAVASVPPAATEGAPGAVAPPVPARIARPAIRAGRKRLVRTVLLVAVLLLVLNEIGVGFTAGRMAAAVTTRDLDDLADTWSAYGSLSRRSYLRLGILGLERTLRARSKDLAEQVIGNYRSPTPTVRERQWQAAADNLRHALGIGPDRRLTAALRYCEGHLHRIDGEAARRRGQTVTAHREFTEAVAAFREAAELRADWPDPFLGLARTFIYGLDDIDRAADALRQAQGLGYKVGDRETAQLADGYRSRGDTLARTARQLRDLPQEAEYLRRAIEAYKEALTLCEQIPGFPGIARNIRRVRAAIDSNQERLAEVDLTSQLSEVLSRWR